MENQIKALPIEIKKRAGIMNTIKKNLQITDSKVSSVSTDSSDSTDSSESENDN